MLLASTAVSKFYRINQAIEPDQFLKFHLLIPPCDVPDSSPCYKHRDFLTTFCNRIIMGLQGFTKCGENTRPPLAAVRMLLCSKDPIVIPASRKTAYSKVQLEEVAQSVGLR
jgi:hypothetical protein